MSIKPDDCIVDLRDLQVVYYLGAERGGEVTKRTSWRKDCYWDKFITHIFNTTKTEKGIFLTESARRKNEKLLDERKRSELAKYHCVHKSKAGGGPGYLKFETEADLTYFILMWS